MKKSFYFWNWIKSTTNVYSIKILTVSFQVPMTSIIEAIPIVTSIIPVISSNQIVRVLTPVVWDNQIIIASIPLEEGSIHIMVSSVRLGIWIPV